MKLIARVHDHTAAHEITSLLKGKGIPTYVHQLGGSMGFGLQHYWIHVCMDHQLADAIALLRDPDHVVKEPVDVEAFERDAQVVDGRILKWSVVVMVVVVALMVSGLWALDVPLGVGSPEG